MWKEEGMKEQTKGVKLKTFSRYLIPPAQLPCLSKLLIFLIFEEIRNPQSKLTLAFHNKHL
jgi:hypothetical protein